MFLKKIFYNFSPRPLENSPIFILNTRIVLLRVVRKIRVIEAGIVLNGVDIVHLENEEYKINKNSDLRAALLHSIIIILEDLGEQDFYHFLMKKTLLLVFKRKFKESDLIFYVILKPSAYDQATFHESALKMIEEFKFRFSNIYNKFCELFDEHLHPDISIYWKILPHLANLLMVRFNNGFDSELQIFKHQSDKCEEIPASISNPPIF